MSHNRNIIGYLYREGVGERTVLTDSLSLSGKGEGSPGRFWEFFVVLPENNPPKALL